MAHRRRCGAPPGDCRHCGQPLPGRPRCRDGHRRRDRQGRQAGGRPLLPELGRFTAVPCQRSHRGAHQPAGPGTGTRGHLQERCRPVSGKDTPRDSIAKALQVGTLVEGNVEQDKDRVRVTVRLIDAASNADSSARHFEQPAGSALSLSDSLAQKAALFLRERLGVELRLREQRSSTAKSTEAWILLQRAEQARKEAERRRLGATRCRVPRGSPRRTRLRGSRPPRIRPGTIRWCFAVVSTTGAPGSPWRVRRRRRHSLIREWVSPRRRSGRDNADPDALELRGTLEYWKWLLRWSRIQRPQRPCLPAPARTSRRRRDSSRRRPVPGLAEPPLLPRRQHQRNRCRARRPSAYESDAYLKTPRRSSSDSSMATMTSTRRWMPRTGAKRDSAASRRTGCSPSARST